MTSDDRPDADASPLEEGANRYGAGRTLGRDDRSLYGSGVPGSPPAVTPHTSTEERPPETDMETEADLMHSATGVGPNGPGAFVDGSAGGVLGAAASAAGAASMGSGEARGGMAGSDEDAEGIEASKAPGVVRKGPGTETDDGPTSGGQAGTGPQTPAM